MRLARLGCYRHDGHADSTGFESASAEFAR